MAQRRAHHIYAKNECVHYYNLHLLFNARSIDIEFKMCMCTRFCGVKDVNFSLVKINFSIPLAKYREGEWTPQRIYVVKYDKVTPIA